MFKWIKKHKVWAVLIVVALGVMAFGMMELTMQPFFCASCHEMDRVYVSWHNSPHSEIACMKCHSEPGIVGLVKAKVEALKSPYYHIMKNDEGVQELLRHHTPTPDSACLHCHPDILSVSRVVNINAPHKLHYTMSTADCQNCHENIGHLGALPENDVALHMSLCMNCHEENSDTAAPQRDDCEACHVGEREMHVGRGGLEVDELEGMMPDLDCVDCHTNEENFQPTKESCEDCHDEGYFYWITTWQDEVTPLFEEATRKYEEVRALEKDIKANPELNKAFEVGRQNYLIVDHDGSKGVHNFDYAVELLEKAIEKFDLILSSS